MKRKQFENVEVIYDDVSYDERKNKISKYVNATTLIFAFLCMAAIFLFIATIKVSPIYYVLLLFFGIPIVIIPTLYIGITVEKRLPKANNFINYIQQLKYVEVGWWNDELLVYHTSDSYNGYTLFENFLCVEKEHREFIDNSNHMKPIKVKISCIQDKTKIEIVNT